MMTRGGSPWTTKRASGGAPFAWGINAIHPVAGRFTQKTAAPATLPGAAGAVGVSMPLLFLNVRATVVRVACVRASVATTRTVNAANAVAPTGTESRALNAP